MVRGIKLMALRGRAEGLRARMAGRVLLALAPILAPGCGPDPEIISKQGEQIRREYERQKYEPPGLTPQEKQVRRERIEQEYGGLVPD